MIVTQVAHGAGSDRPLWRVRGGFRNSRFAVGAALALLALLAGAHWEVSKRRWGAAPGVSSHIAAAGVISTGELRSTVFPGLYRALTSAAHARRSRTARRHCWAASFGGCIPERSPVRSSSPGVLVAGVWSIRLSFLLFRTTLLAAQTGMISSWTTANPPPAKT